MISDARGKTVLPAGACDSHIHVFGAADTYPLVTTADFVPEPSSVGEYCELSGELGLSRVVVVQPSVYGFDNRCTVEAVAAIGLHRARGVVQLESGTPEVELRELHAAGMRGVRFITLASGGAALDDLAAVADMVASLGWHVQMYIEADRLVELGDDLLELPVPVVLDHLAGLRADVDHRDPSFLAVCRLLESGSCWVKVGSARASVTGPPYDDVTALTRTLVDVAPDRCVWGTDWPHPNTRGPVPDDRLLLRALQSALPRRELLDQVLEHNPARLYGFDNTHKGASDD